MSAKDKEIFVIVAVVSGSYSLESYNYSQNPFSIRKGAVGNELSVDVLFLFSQKKNEPKRKVAAGPYCYDNAVVRQGQWLPQHCQCCMRRGYVRKVAGSGIIKFHYFLALNSWLSSPANSFGQKRAEQWWPVRWKEALEILQKGRLVRCVSGAKDPGLCCSDGLCGMAMCVKKPFADERFGYFGAPK